MSTSSQTDGRSAHEALIDRVYDSIGEFNEVACWGVLQSAQARRYLAEHLANDLRHRTDGLAGGAR